MDSSGTCFITTIEDRTVVAYGCRRTKKLNDGPVADTYGYTFNADIFFKPVFLILIKCNKRSLVFIVGVNYKTIF